MRRRCGRRGAPSKRYGTSASFDSLTISGILADSSDSFVVIDGTLSAPTIEIPGQPVAGPGPSRITSPALSSTGKIEILNGASPLPSPHGRYQRGRLGHQQLADPAHPFGSCLAEHLGHRAVAATSAKPAHRLAGRLGD